MQPDAVQAAKLNRYLAEVYPARRHLEVVGLDEIRGGWETQIFACVLRYQLHGVERQEELILRLYPGSRGREQAVHEHHVLQRVAEHGVTVPQVVRLELDASPFGDPFILMERIHGDRLDQVLRSVPPEQLEMVIEQMVAVLVRVHRIPWREVFPSRTLADASHDEATGFVPPDLAVMHRTARRPGFGAFVPVLAWLEARSSPAPAGAQCLLHNDFHSTNLIQRAMDGELVVLDWSFAGVGDYRLDLAWSALLLEVLLDGGVRQLFLEHYGVLAGQPVEDLEYFEVLKFTARMMTIAGWLDESTVIPVPKITRQAIRTTYRVHVLNVYNRLKVLTGLSIPLFETL